MNNRCMIAWLVIACCFGVASSEAQAPKAKAVDKPAGKLGLKEPAVNEIAAPQPPAVAAILATHPTTPAECVQAAKTLVDLGYAEVAKPFVVKVLEAKPTPEQLAELGDQFGASLFVELAAQAALLPEARQLADAVAAAVAAKREDPKRIAALIAQLQDPSDEKRLQALAGLQESRHVAIAPLISVLADPARAGEQANVRRVLAGMGRPARHALVAALEATDPKLKAQVILTLAEMNDPKVAIHLLEPCLSEKNDASVRAAATAALKQFSGQIPSKPQAIEILAEAARNAFDHRQPVEGVIEGRVDLWRWDASKGQCVVVSVTAADVARVSAARFARALYALNPDGVGVRRLYLATLLDAAAYTNGLDTPLDEKNPAVVEARQFGADALNEVLRFTVTERHPAAAAAAARLLGEIGKAEALLYEGEQPAPLVRSLQDPDRRLRLAAARAIVRLQPVRPYAGSSYLPSALGFLAGSRGSRYVLVGGPNLQQARDLAGMTASSGYLGDTAGQGRNLLLLATQSPDYEYCWIDVGIDHPEIALLVEEFRRDARTARLPLGLVARDGFSDLAECVARSDPMSTAFARPHDEPSVKWQIEQLAALAPGEFVDFAARQRQAEEALDLLLELSRSPGKLYDLRGVQDSVLVALGNPRLAMKAVAFLGTCNSAESQRALVEVVGRSTAPLELRTASAASFRENTRKHGILLTTDEIRQQYRRYNESENGDAQTQKLLGLILDCLEAPTADGVPPLSKRAR